VKAAAAGPLFFRNGDEDYHQYHSNNKANQQQQPQPPHRGHNLRSTSNDQEGPQRWWGNLIPTKAPPTEEDETSARVDEYLKFLDKRYHQIHDEDEETASSFSRSGGMVEKNGFSVLKWLQKDQGLEFHHNNENAVFALNTAARQVEELNQPAQQQPKEEESQTVDMVRSEDGSFRAKVISLQQSPTVRWIVQSRRALLRFPAAQLAAATGQALKSIPKLPALFWKASGGKAPLTVALAVTSVLLVHILIPAIGALIRESIAVQA